MESCFKQRLECRDFEKMGRSAWRSAALAPRYRVCLCPITHLQTFRVRTCNSQLLAYGLDSLVEIAMQVPYTRQDILQIRRSVGLRNYSRRNNRIEGEKLSSLWHNPTSARLYACTEIQPEGGRPTGTNAQSKYRIGPSSRGCEISALCQMYAPCTQSCQTTSLKADSKDA